VSLTVWVFDPTEGKKIPLNIRKKKNGEVHITRLPLQNFSGGEIPRPLETKPAIIEVASGTFGKKWIVDGVPTWQALRDEMPRRTLEFKNPRRSVRGAKQEHYRSLVSPAVLEFVKDQEGIRWRYRQRPGVTDDGQGPVLAGPSVELPSVPSLPVFPQRPVPRKIP
jgi:hypothetical protein